MLEWSSLSPAPTKEKRIECAKRKQLSYSQKKKMTLERHTEVLSGKGTDLREDEQLKHGTEIRLKATAFSNTHRPPS